MKSVDELVAEAERLWKAEPAGGVGVTKAAALLAAALPQHRGELRLVTKLMMYTRMAGRPRSAVLIGREVEESAGDDRDFLYEYGIDLRLGGLWRQAMETHHRLAAQNVGDDDAQFAWAISQSVYGLPNGMLEVIDELLRRHPANPRYRYGRARVLARLGRLRDAASELESILRGEPQFVDGWLLLGRVARRLHWDDRWKAAAQHISRLALPATAELWAFYVAADAGDANAAQKHIARAIDLDPEAHEPLVEEGRFLFEMYQRLGEKRLLADAERALTLATQAAPDDGEALGRLLELQVITKRGAPDLRAARQKAEDRPHAGLPRFLARIVARVDPGQAEPLYRLWLGACAEDVEAWVELGDVLTEIDRAADAAAAFARAAELSPGFAPAWNGLGYARLQAGDHAKAAEAYQKAIATGMDVGAVRDAYATALTALGRTAEALAELDQAIAEEPDEPLYRLHRAEALVAAGRDAEARSVAEAVRDRAEGDVRVHLDELLARLRR